ncbi:phage tail tape measure protein [Lysobacter brunescens]|uniref:Phage tail tape measure protein n=1 Tax=Lysobacter brunescens TaxID=262323 RepID=A0ABW2YGE6_9GAMM
MDKLQLELILSAIDRATRPLRAINKESGATAKALRQSKDELAALNALQQRVQGFRKLKIDADASKVALAAATQRLKAIKAATEGTVEPTRKQAVELARATRALEKSRATHVANLGALRRSREGLQAAGISVAKLSQHEKDLAMKIAAANTRVDQQTTKLRALADANRRVQRAQEAVNKAQAAAANLRSTGASATAGAGAMGAATLAPILAFAKQQEAAAQLQASMMGADGRVSAEFAKLDALAKSLGDRLPGTTSDFYEMLTMLRRQGMSSTVILGGLGEATAYLGAQLRIPYTEAAEFSAKLQDATRTSERDMLALSDVIQRTFYLGVDQNNMLQGFSKLSPALSTLRMEGLQAAEALAPLLVLADQAGIKGEAAGNAFRKAFQYSLDLKKLGNANEILAGTGIKLDFSDGRGEFAGLEKMYAQLAQLRRLDTQTRNAVINKMFGDDAETMQVVTIMIEKGMAGYREVQAKMAAQANLQTRVNSQLGTIRALWETATGTLTNVLATAGETVRPDIEKLIKTLGRYSERAGKWIRENPQLTAGLLKMAAVATVLFGVFGIGAMAVSALLGPLAMARYAVTGLGVRFGPLMRNIMPLARNAIPMLMHGLRLLLPLFAGISGPVLIVIAVVALLAGVIYKYWKPIKAFLSGFFDGMKQSLAPVMDQLMAALEPLRPVLDAVSGALGDVWTWITELLTPVNSTSEELKNAEGYGRKFANVLSIFVVPAIQGAIMVIGWIAEALAVAFKWSPLGLIISNWDAIKAYFTGLPARMRTIGGQIMDGLRVGIEIAMGPLTSVIKRVGNMLPDGLRAKLGIKSPSRVFMGIGQHTMAGLALGITGNSGLPVRAIDALQGRVQAAGEALARGRPGTATRPGTAPAGAARGQGGGNTYAITIKVANGDPNTIKRAVREGIAEADRARQTRTRSALTDSGD